MARHRVAANRAIFKWTRLSMIVMTLGILPVSASISRAEESSEQKIVRFATWNVSLNRTKSGQLVNDLKGGTNAQASAIAEVIQRVRPDVLLINEFDFDEAEEAAKLFCEEYLQVGQNGHSPVLYPFIFVAPVNTGTPSNVDLDGDGRSNQPNDAYGFGRFPGQYGMLVLSRFPLQPNAVRTFQKFLWKEMPGALLPVSPEGGQPYYSEQALSVFRLSSKSHWDIPLEIGKRTVHVLAAHPTPPAFDGPEKRNGYRNHDEIRLWADYIDPQRAGYLYDDQGTRGGLTAGSQFVILGDYNSDPVDGETVRNAIDQLLKHPLVNHDLIPMSRGAAESSIKLGNKNLKHRGAAEQDTANFSDGDGPGNLRVDYVLPSRTLGVSDAGVFWPTSDEAGVELIEASDHRLVWVDVKLTP